MQLITSKDGTKQIPAWYGTRAKTGPSEPMQPLKGAAQIEAVRAVVQHSPRDLALFTIGINTAYRAGDYLAWKVGDVRGLQPGETIRRKEQKTGKYRDVNLNGACIRVINALLDARPNATDEEFLFVGADGVSPISVNWYGTLVKRWCHAAGLKGSFGSHTLRKTWGYMQRTVCGMPLDKIQKAYGHSSSSITLTYVCIQDEEMRDMYMHEF